MSGIAEKGKVYLVGAGPGDPEQLTVRALQLLSSADFIFHDDLVPSRILALAQADAQVVSVGKRCGRKSISQDEINTALVREARAGHSVVRLKSGDPLLFGRAAEELEALKAARIPLEVAPGISAAFAAASALQTSLTYRRFASKIIFLTAHRAEHSIAPVWSGALPGDVTLAIYMPGTDYGRLGSELMACGLPCEMPAVVISHIGLPDQRIQQSTLSQLFLADSLPAPALLLVGQVFASNITLTQNESLCAASIDDRLSDPGPGAMVGTAALATNAISSKSAEEPGPWSASSTRRPCTASSIPSC